MQIRSRRGDLMLGSRVRSNDSHKVACVARRGVESGPEGPMRHPRLCSIGMSWNPG